MEQGAGSMEHGAESREQKAWSREQKAGSMEQGAGSLVPGGISSAQESHFLSLLNSSFIEHIALINPITIGRDQFGYGNSPGLHS
jgi:hypothetical protein